MKKPIIFFLLFVMLPFMVFSMTAKQADAVLKKHNFIYEKRTIIFHKKEPVTMAYLKKIDDFTISVRLVLKNKKYPGYHTKSSGDSNRMRTDKKPLIDLTRDGDFDLKQIVISGSYNYESKKDKSYDSTITYATRAKNLSKNVYDVTKMIVADSLKEPTPLNFENIQIPQDEKFLDQEHQSKADTNTFSLSYAFAHAKNQLPYTRVVLNLK